MHTDVTGPKFHYFETQKVNKKQTKKKKKTEWT